MRRLVFPLLLLVIFSGCFLRNTRTKRGGLEIVYITELPKDNAGWADIKATVDAFEADPLVIVDDPEFYDYESIALWDGHREVYLLETLGCDICFPPAQWQLIGSRSLHDIANRADFFAVGLDLVDDSANYVLSRYLIRQQSPYRLAFTASARRFDSHDIQGYSYLPLDSLLTVTSNFLRLQADFFFFFGPEADSIPSGVEFIERGGDNRVIEIRFISRISYKLKEQSLSDGQAGASPLGMWKAYKDTLDDVVLAEIETPLDTDSLQTLVVEAAKELAGDSIEVIIPDSFVKKELSAGKVTFGGLRQALTPEIFLLVSMQVEEVEEYRLQGYFFSGEIADSKVLVPYSILKDNSMLEERPVRPTSVTTSQIAREMFIYKGEQ